MCSENGKWCHPEDRECFCRSAVAAHFRFPPPPPRTCSHALWMSWDTGSRVCGVCCRLRSNNSLAPLAPCPAPANSTTPDRRLTCMDSWHGYWPNQIRSLVLKCTTILGQICVLETDSDQEAPRGVRWHWVSAIVDHAPPTVRECESRFCRATVWTRLL